MLCLITAKIVKPTVRQLYHQRRRRLLHRRCRRYFVAVVYESWSSISTFWYIITKIVELPPLSNTDSNIDGGCNGSDDTSSQLSMSPDPPYPKSIATKSQRSSHLIPVTSPQWTMSHGLPSDATSQQAYDPTITAYNDVDYLAASQPSPKG